MDEDVAVRRMNENRRDAQRGGVAVQLDMSFDFRSDAGGKDPDTHSPTLRRYHQALWSKPLPNGLPFTLEPTRTAYLHHRSEIGEFWLFQRLRHGWHDRMRDLPDADREGSAPAVADAGDRLVAHVAR